jgi:hypothetical protein
MAPKNVFAGRHCVEICTRSHAAGRIVNEEPFYWMYGTRLGYESGEEDSLVWL